MTCITITPFETAQKVFADECENHPSVVLNGHDLTPAAFHDAAVLKMLADSPLREQIEELRHALNEALGPVRKWPAKDVADAIALLLPHLRSGFIKSIRSEDGGLVIEGND